MIQFGQWLGDSSFSQPPVGARVEGRSEAHGLLPPQRVQSAAGPSDRVTHQSAFSVIADNAPALVPQSSAVSSGLSVLTPAYLMAHEQMAASLVRSPLSETQGEGDAVDATEAVSATASAPPDAETIANPGDAATPTPFRTTTADSATDSVPRSVSARVPQGQTEASPPSGLFSATETPGRNAISPRGLSIVAVGAQDIEKHRWMQTTKQAETRVEFSLRTLDGDEISFSFHQIDLEDVSRFKGNTEGGARGRNDDDYRMSHRLVRMEVSGDLSDAETAAIQKVFSSVVEVAQRFFTGDMAGAVQKLGAMEFDSSSLAELSLNMSMYQSVEVARAYQHEAGIMNDLRRAEGETAEFLQSLADETKRMIRLANEVLDAPSAVNIVKTLLQTLMKGLLDGDPARVGSDPVKRADPSARSGEGQTLWV